MTAERTRIILWRHGQTDSNVEMRYQGQTDVPLNATGVAQAAEAAGLLAKQKVDAIVSSPLSRALTTAQTLADLLGLPVTTDDRLKEISVGSWEGMLDVDVRRENPDFAEALASGRDVRRSATGETAAEVGQRVGAAVREIAAAHQGQTVVVGCHGLAIRMGTANLLGWDFATSQTLASMHNCGWTVLVARGNGEWKLVTWNQAPMGRLA